MGRVGRLRERQRFALGDDSGMEGQFQVDLRTRQGWQVGRAGDLAGLALHPAMRGFERVFAAEIAGAGPVLQREGQCFVLKIGHPMREARRHQGNSQGDKQRHPMQGMKHTDHSRGMAQDGLLVNGSAPPAAKRPGLRIPGKSRRVAPILPCSRTQAMPNQVPVFDGHNDIVLKIAAAGKDRAKLWLQGEGAGHLDLPRMLKHGFAGGFFAVYIPSPEEGEPVDHDALMDNPPYDLPLPDLIGHTTAQPVAVEMLGHLLWMERASEGRFRWCRSAADIRAAMAAGVVAGVLHFEGAEPIGPNLDALHLFHAMGLRSLGPVWSRPTIFGHGVPFRFPSTGDTGPGLTDLGKALVRECNALRIMIDLSHLNEAGFWDVAKLSDAPLVATHSNAHAVTPSSRNLSDRQLQAIGETGGMAGLNFATCFLRPDGRRGADMTLDPVKRHIEHMLKLAGEDHVGLGSDYDGATTPQDIGGVEGLPVLVGAMREMGLGETLITKIAHGNWLRLLERTWGG